MRRAWWVAFVAACGPGSVAGGGPGMDARPGSADGAMAPDAAPAASPSPANRGWIGGACDGAGDCPFAGGMCLTDGFPNGMCTEECGGVCPDRRQAGDTITACVDGRPFGFDRGLCVSRCDRAVLPPTGCAEGYVCLPKNQWLDATGVVEVCVPAAPHGPCDGEDEVVRVDYPDRGALWIPREAQCGGSFPLLVHLHGLNRSNNPTPAVGGGRHVEYLVRSLIDYGIIRPLLLAEPVDTGTDSMSSTTLYAPDHFEPATHLERLRPHLQSRGIQLASLSYSGHSGAGCDADNGLYLVLKRLAQLVPAQAPSLALWGLEDVCYEGAYHVTAPRDALGGKNVALINVWSGQNDPTAFENGLFPSPQPMPCATAIFGKCIRHAVEPWCSYRTSAASGVGHEDNPLIFLREALPQVFAVDGSVTPCR